MTTWFTSDQHVGHRKVASYRGFGINGVGELAGTEAVDIPAHDAWLAEQWDSVVQPSDTVWLLGDLCLGSTGTTERALKWVSERPGEKILIAGNHDRINSIVDKNAYKWMRRYHEVFLAVYQFYTLKIAGQEVWLSHYPLVGDHTREDRFNAHRLRDEGQWVLHGHTHSSERRSGPKSIHVGVDAWNMTPIPQSEIEAIILEST